MRQNTHTLKSYGKIKAQVEPSTQNSDYNLYEDENDICDIYNMYSILYDLEDRYKPGGDLIDNVSEFLAGCLKEINQGNTILHDWKTLESLQLLHQLYPNVDLNELDSNNPAITEKTQPVYVSDYFLRHYFKLHEITSGHYQIMNDRRLKMGELVQDIVEKLGGQACEYLNSNFQTNESQLCVKENTDACYDFQNPEKNFSKGEDPWKFWFSKKCSCRPGFGGKYCETPMVPGRINIPSESPSITDHITDTSQPRTCQAVKFIDSLDFSNHLLPCFFTEAFLAAFVIIVAVLILMVGQKKSRPEPSHQQEPPEIKTTAPPLKFQNVDMSIGSSKSNSMTNVSKIDDTIDTYDSFTTLPGSYYVPLSQVGHAAPATSTKIMTGPTFVCHQKGRNYRLDTFD